MARTTKKQLIEKVAGLQAQGFDISIHWANDQPACESIDQSRTLSPRLPMGQMSLWLHGFATGARAYHDALNKDKPERENILGTMRKRAAKGIGLIREVSTDVLTEHKKKHGLI